MNRDRFSTLATALLVLCALTITAAVVRREFFPPQGAAAQAPDMKPRAVDNWDEIAAAGQWMGPRTAKVQIVEFSDFQCPFCAKFQTVLRSVRAKHPEDVAVVYRHFPLQAIHPHAGAAALASECAAVQGRFEAYHDLLFAQQDSIGTKPWARFAAEAAVPDAAAFDRCMADQRLLLNVDRDLRVAQATDIDVTPTLVINGTLVPGIVSEAQLEEHVAKALAGAGR